MKNKKIIILVVVLLLLALLVFKIIMLNKYKSIEIELDTSSIFNETLTIKKEQDESESQVIKVDGLMVKDYFNDYEKKDEYDLYVKYNDAGEIVSHCSISSYKQYINLLSIDSLKLYSENDRSKKNFDTEKSMRSFLNKKNIKNDVDFLKYIKENYYFKNNIFTCTKTMRNNFLINTFVEVTLPSFENIVLLDGDVNGYIININKSMKEIRLMKDEKQYIITMTGEELINNEFITKLLSTIEFE